MAKTYRFAFKNLDVYRLAVEHFDWTCQVLDRIPNAPFKLSNQAIGASLSIMGNLGEANGRDVQPKEVVQSYRYAQGETFESATHLDAFSSLGAISDDEYNAEEERLARIAAMVAKLMERQRRKAHQARQRKLERRAAAQRNAAEPRKTKVELKEKQDDEPRPQPPQATSNPRNEGSRREAPAIESAQRAVAARSDAIESPQRGVPSERSEPRDRKSNAESR